MKKTFKLLVTILAFAMVLTSFAGCGSENSTNAGNNEQNNSSTQNTDIEQESNNPSSDDASVKEVENRIAYPNYEDLFRKCIAFYACISAETINKEFSTAAIDALTIAKIKKELLPVLGKQGHYDLDAEKAIAKNYIKDLMILSEPEKEFIQLLPKLR